MTVRARTAFSSGPTIASKAHRDPARGSSPPFFRQEKASQLLSKWSGIGMCLAVSRALTGCQRMRGSLDHKENKRGQKGGAEVEVLMEGPSLSQPK